MSFKDKDDEFLEQFFKDMLSQSDLNEAEIEELKDRLAVDGFDLQDLFDMEATKEMLLLDNIEETLEEYSLFKQPPSNQLEDCLTGYTKDVLANIGEDNGLEISKSWKKERMVQVLYEHIRETLSERIILLGNHHRVLLEQAIEQEFSLDKLGKDETDFFMEVFPMAIKLGLIFARIDSVGELRVIVSTECTEALNTLRQHQNKVKPQMKWYRDMNKVLKATIHLYGVAHMDHFFNFWDILHPNHDATVEFYEVVHKILPILAAQNSYLFLSNGLIGAKDFEYKEAANEFYWDIRFKMKNNYYVPTRQDIDYFGSKSFDRESKQYRTLKEVIKQVSSFPNEAMLVIEHNLRLGAMSSEMFEDLQELDLLELPGLEDMEKLFNAYLKLNNETRMWVIAGYKPSEMSR